MEFILLFTAPQGGPPPRPEGMAEMTRLAQELASQGKLRRGAPLGSESAGASVRVRDGKALVIDGPFAESKEVIGGFWVIDVAGRAEAIEVARRCPHARVAPVEVHRLEGRHAFTDREEGTPFLLVFRKEPGLGDADGAEREEMTAFGRKLARDGKLLETAPLADDPPPARIEGYRGSARVTAGPFAETQEAIGGYSIVRVAGRAEAIELAKESPHARRGPVEVREILFFDRTAV